MKTLTNAEWSKLKSTSIPRATRIKTILQILKQRAEKPIQSNELIDGCNVTFSDGKVDKVNIVQLYGVSKGLSFKMLESFGLIKIDKTVKNKNVKNNTGLITWIGSDVTDEMAENLHKYLMEYNKAAMVGKPAVVRIKYKILAEEFENLNREKMMELMKDHRPKTRDTTLNKLYEYLFEVYARTLKGYRAHDEIIMVAKEGKLVNISNYRSNRITNKMLKEFGFIDSVYDAEIKGYLCKWIAAEPPTKQDAIDILRWCDFLNSTKIVTAEELAAEKFANMFTPKPEPKKESTEAKKEDDFIRTTINVEDNSELVALIRTTIQEEFSKFTAQQLKYVKSLNETVKKLNSVL